MMTQVPGAGGAPGVQGAVNTGFVRVFLDERDARTVRSSRSRMSCEYSSAASRARASTSRRKPASARSAGSVTGVQFVIQAPDVEALREMLPAVPGQCTREPGVHLRRQRPEVQQAGGARELRSRQGAGAGRQRAGHRADAAGVPQRAALRVFHSQGQAVRRDRPAHARLPLAARRSGQHRRAHARWRRAWSGSTIWSRCRRAARRRSCIATTATLRGDGVRHARSGTTPWPMASPRSSTRRAATLDERFTTSLTGPARDFVESSPSLGWVFALALLLIYLVLAAQFESFADPFVILLTVPLARGRRAAGAVVLRPDAEHLFADRTDHAGRAGHEERHPDRRVRQPASRGRSRERPRRRAGSGVPPACGPSS